MTGSSSHKRSRDDAAASAEVPHLNTELHVEEIEIASIQPHPDNPRVHPKKQIRQIADSIKAFGFRVPVLVDQDSRLICGHARVEACKLIGMGRVPALRVTDLSDTQVRALMIADNRLAEISTWDDKLLGENLKVLSDLELNFDIETVGFEYGEIEQRILDLDSTCEIDDESDDSPDLEDVAPVTRLGDLWILGEGESPHRILCADCTKPESFKRLLGDRHAAMVFTDPPYNLSAKVIGQVCAGEHGDFEMASGEMTPEQFTEFLGTVMEQLCAASEPGSIHYLFMDRRHASEMLAAGQAQSRYSYSRSILMRIESLTLS